MREDGVCRGFPSGEVMKTLWRVPRKRHGAKTRDPRSMIARLGKGWSSFASQPRLLAHRRRACVACFASPMPFREWIKDRHDRERVSRWHRQGTKSKRTVGPERWKRASSNSKTTTNYAPNNFCHEVRVQLASRLMLPQYRLVGWAHGRTIRQ